MGVPRLGMEAAQLLVDLPGDNDDEDVVRYLDVRPDEPVLEAEIFGIL